MPTLLLGLLGLLMIVAGSMVLLRAAASVRPEVVAKIVGVAIDPGLAAEQSSKRGRSSGGSKMADVFRLKSFEEEVASLNDRIGRREQ